MTALANYPNTVQIGDAFQVRDAGWNTFREGNSC